nr:MAG TPA: hypothetical protein [Caudoviricetes sp.]
MEEIYLFLKIVVKYLYLLVALFGRMRVNTECWILLMLQA